MLGKILKVAGVGAIGAAAIMSASTAHATGNSIITGENLLSTYGCANATYGTSGTYWGSSGFYTSSAFSTSTYSGFENCESNNTANTSGALVTAAATLRAATTQTVNLISGRIAAVNGNANLAKPVTFSLNEEQGQLGLAGGSKNKGLGVWVQGAFTNVKDTNTATKFDGRVFNVAAGIDKRLGKALVGLAVGYENSDLTTTYNLGNIDGKGWFAAPYVSFSINKMINVEGTIGMANLSYDMDRTDSTDGSVYTGKTDADRVFGSVSVNATTNIKKVSLTGTVGLSYAREKRDAFTETGNDIATTSILVGSTTSKLGQARFGGTAAYNAGKVQPYLRVLGEWDLTESAGPTVGASQTAPKDDDFGVRVGLGLNMNLGPNVTATIEGETVLARDKYSEHSGLAKLRIEF